MLDEPTTSSASSADWDAAISRGRYRAMFLRIVLAVSIVALLPLLTMSAIAYRQYQRAFRAESTRPLSRFVEGGEQALESFLSERLAGLGRVARDVPLEELLDAEGLATVLERLQQDFGGIVDVGVIDEDGIQVAYSGPYGLAGRSYSDQPWFREVSARGSTVSDVFLGYRNLPHIVVAVQQQQSNGQPVVLRMTIDTDVFHWLVRDRGTRRPGQESMCLGCHSLAVEPFGDAFIINQEGILQTPSDLYGDVLTPTNLPPFPRSTGTELIELTDASGVPVVAAYARIARSPFILVFVSPQETLHSGWLSLGRELLVFPAISGILILAVIFVGANYFVRQAREADLKRRAVYHKMEYTNKLAAIGRLGAGVAHEINNPLSIITQKTGLLHDLLTMSDEMPPKEKMLDLIDSVLKSVERCGGITHRLLGFAKHMDVEMEQIDLEDLLKEVLRFLEKEASYRNIEIVFAEEGDPPPITSDRGQLQQVFLNIINNAFAAVDEGGRIEIRIAAAGPGYVAVSVEDNGIGIPDWQLDKIFDPFYTTKKGSGTGLGLSITYGIVQKLQGRIDVRSKVGEGTCFTVKLPIAGKHG